ncbi:G protein coupled receptor [Pseudozyma hubeiensis SY62]|uniref:G protein coupled receptor n=1 Tax=Pseudozyma hubeiensis (strain SY62) TaxID=1305764 RepID=R9PEG4_PSEHS|nr:G protein coupled receptor [Pseudozyma hubeiensis SY62]GAC99647.1 G protein coupled receptor [Pseudozyma hubeiensis SY62]
MRIRMVWEAKCWMRDDSQGEMSGTEIVWRRMRTDVMAVDPSHQRSSFFHHWRDVDSSTHCAAHLARIVRALRLRYTTRGRTTRVQIRCRIDTGEHSSSGRNATSGADVQWKGTVDVG